jgi:hypothetical protein
LKVEVLSLTQNEFWKIFNFFWLLVTPKPELQYSPNMAKDSFFQVFSFWMQKCDGNMACQISKSIGQNIVSIVLGTQQDIVKGVHKIVLFIDLQIVIQLLSLLILSLIFKGSTKENERESK